MKVYIEFVILDNLILTSSIAGLSYAACGMKIRKLRTAAAAVVGTAISIFYPYWNLATPLLIAAKLTVGILLAMILFARLQKPLLGILMFFLMTAALGGICLFVNYLIIGDIGEALTGTPVLPYCVPSLIGAVTFFIARALVRAAKKKRVEAPYIYSVAVTIDGKTAEMKGYLDTGNGLYDDATELPIIVVKLESLSKAFGRSEIIRKVVGYKTSVSIGNAAGKLFLIKPDKFLLYSGKYSNKHSDVMLGVSERGFARKEDMLLHPSVIGG